uniref:Uncharacterized protein n=1 Tax=Mycena chlorophos TaxID=658473 RepID=A0ABQ0M212_MYCCL|nr:predicted protein [Mycena chlorophos]
MSSSTNQNNGNKPSLSTKVKGGTKVAQGLNNNIRGTTMAAIDAVEKRDSSANDALARRGRMEMEQGIAMIKGRPVNAGTGAGMGPGDSLQGWGSGINGANTDATVNSTGFPPPRGQEYAQNSTTTSSNSNQPPSYPNPHGAYGDEHKGPSGMGYTNPTQMVCALRVGSECRELVAGSADRPLKRIFLHFASALSSPLVGVNPQHTATLHHSKAAFARSQEAPSTGFLRLRRPEQPPLITLSYRRQLSFINRHVPAPNRDSFVPAAPFPSVAPVPSPSPTGLASLLTTLGRTSVLGPLRILQQDLHLSLSCHLPVSKNSLLWLHKMAHLRCVPQDGTVPFPSLAQTSHAFFSIRRCTTRGASSAFGAFFPPPAARAPGPRPDGTRPLAPRQSIPSTTSCLSACTAINTDATNDAGNLSALCSTSVLNDYATCYDCLVSAGASTADEAQEVVDGYVQACVDAGYDSVSTAPTISGAGTGFTAITPTVGTTAGGSEETTSSVEIGQPTPSTASSGSTSGSDSGSSGSSSGSSKGSSSGGDAASGAGFHTNAAPHYRVEAAAVVAGMLVGVWFGILS